MHLYVTGICVLSSPIVKSVPLLKDLYTHITPFYAADWEIIGTLLGISSGELRTIEAGYPTNTKRCCNKMFEQWLEMDLTATWEKVFAAIDSPAICSHSSAGNCNCML